MLQSRDFKSKKRVEESHFTATVVKGVCNGTPLIVCREETNQNNKEYVMVPGRETELSITE